VRQKFEFKLRVCWAKWYRTVNFPLPAFTGLSVRA